MGRAPRRYTCRVGMRSSRPCPHAPAGKVTILCKYGHVTTLWMCERHLKVLKERDVMVCKPCYRMDRKDVKVNAVSPLVADLPLAFRRLAAQFDSE